MIEKSNLSSSERLVLIMLAKHSNADDECWPAAKLLASSTALSIRTVKSCVKRLRRLGYIRTARRRRNDGTNSSLLFTIDWRKLQGATIAPCQGATTALGPGATVALLSTPQDKQPPNGSGGWVDDICSDWFAAYGGRIRKHSTEKAMSHLVADHGITTVRQRWQYYLRSHPDLEGRYANVHRFVATFGIWTEVKARSRRAAMRNGEPDL